MPLSPEDQRALAAERRSAPSGAAGSVALASPARKSGTATPKPRVSSNSTGQYSKPMSVPSGGAGAVPDINGFLGSDISYQDQLRQFAQALSDMNADVTRRRGSLQSQYGQSQKAMGDQRTKDLSDLEADYGSRGLLRSGLYAKAQGDYETEYNTRLADLGRQQTDATGMLDQELNQFTSQQNLQSQAAKEAAIRRRAEQYGV